MWDQAFGHLTHARPPLESALPVVVVDWGGKMRDRDLLWQQAMVSYLSSSPIGALRGVSILADLWVVSNVSLPTPAVPHLALVCRLANP